MTTTQKQLLNRLKNKVIETFNHELTKHSISKRGNHTFIGTPGIGQSDGVVTFQGNTLTMAVKVVTERMVTLESTFNNGEMTSKTVDVELFPAFFEDNVDAVDDAVNIVRYSIQDALNDFEAQVS